MAKITVTADPTTPDRAPVLLEESVYSVHLSTDHAARQLIERLLWALDDAEEFERQVADPAAAQTATADRRPALSR